MNRKAKQGIKAKKRKTSSKARPPLLGMTLTGIVDMTKSGSAYITIESLGKDVFVRKEDLGTALNGDTVKVRVTYVSKSGKLEGEVTSVTKRSQEEFIGVLQLSKNYGFVVPESKKITFDIFIPKSEIKGAQEGDKVLVKVVEWNDGVKNPIGTIIDNLSHERENQVAMKEILLEHGFKIGFSDKAIEESLNLKGDITAKELSKRRDCRDIPTFTIDPVDAKDFDDALSIRPLKGGYYEVGVHIADVSHFIKPGSTLDEEAYVNATSVYLPDRVLPMLPENISNVLCSLRPNEDKYTFSIIFQINEKGHVKQYWIGRTVIHSDRRFTYEEAQEIIEGAEGDFKEEILTLNKIARNLRKERFDNGAINFSSQEIRFQLDEQGKPIGIVIKESKEAHQLIEEFMLLANRYIAQYVQKIKVNGQPIPFPYRVHPLPDELKIAQFAAFAARFGYKLNINNPDEIARSFNEMLQQLKGKPEEHLLQELGIRTMSKALYTTGNEGHYGLGFDDYCHFTSPIRRYPDILVHRIVQQCLDGKIEFDKKMEQKCKHCSERERKAMEAERKANKYKQVEFMQNYIGEELEAIVSGVSVNGFWAQTVEQRCEGMVSIAELAPLDQFDFIEADYALIGRHTGLRFRIGDKVIIRVDNVSLETRTIDFSFIQKVGGPELRTTKAKKTKSKKSTTKAKASKASKSKKSAEPKKNKGKKK